jgi:hypothetical protein
MTKISDENIEKISTEEELTKIKNEDLPEIKGFRISTAFLIILQVISFLLILTVGLVCGLVVRPKNCIEPITTITTTLPTTTTTTTTTTTQNILSYKIILGNVASVRASYRAIIGTNIDVTLIESTVYIYF